MKQILFSFLVMSTLLFTDYSMAQTAKTKSEAAPKAPKTPKAPKGPKNETLTGTYQSKRGVMTPLSCYCSNGGILTVGENEVKICFDKLGKEPQDCKTIIVTGHYETLSNDPDETSPCEKGTMEVFVVEKFKCK
ncbi:MAG TPA: hypothetical protein VK151_06115 [Fluviicola sp.]|nr:hypothetical protein [Fluviicola sp.]